jgi:hypothetical protein
MTASSAGDGFVLVHVVGPADGRRTIPLFRFAFGARSLWIG